MPSQIAVKIEKSVGDQSRQGSLQILNGTKVNLPDRSLIQYPWAMHIYDYQQKKDTPLVLRRGMPFA